MQQVIDPTSGFSSKGIVEKPSYILHVLELHGRIFQ